MHRIIIDWISFTIETDTLSPEASAAAINATWDKAFWQAFGSTSQQFTDLFSDAEEFYPRPPYNHCWKHSLGETFAHPGRNHMLFEMTGGGCERLREERLEKYVLKTFAERITRLDLAIDWKTDVMPSLFRNLAEFGRFKSHSFVKSHHGETLYIGSRKSSRYLRIYKYKPPHPRHELLRFEFVFRKDHAKHIASELVSTRYDYASLARQSLCDFGMWTLAAMIEGGSFDIGYQKTGTKKAGTVAWLITQVAPAFQRLVKDNVITEPDKFLQEHFLNG